MFIEFSESGKFVGIDCSADEFVSLCEAELILNRMPHCDMVDKSVYEQLSDALRKSNHIEKYFHYR